MHIIASIGQIIFGAYWLYNGINHFTGLTPMTGYAAAKGVPAPKASVIIGGILLVLGGLGILLGLYTRLAILLLIIFIIPVTLMVHNFWAVTDQNQKMSERISFTKNAALFASLLLLWTIAFPYSVFGM